MVITRDSESRNGSSNLPVGYDILLFLGQRVSTLGGWFQVLGYINPDAYIRDRAVVKVDCSFWGTCFPGSSKPRYVLVI